MSQQEVVEAVRAQTSLTLSLRVRVMVSSSSGSGLVRTSLHSSTRSLNLPHTLSSPTFGSRDGSSELAETASLGPLASSTPRLLASDYTVGFEGAVRGGTTPRLSLGGNSSLLSAGTPVPTLSSARLIPGIVVGTKSGGMNSDEEEGLLRRNTGARLLGLQHVASTDV